MPFFDIPYLIGIRKIRLGITVQSDKPTLPQSLPMKGGKYLFVYLQLKRIV